MDATWCFKYRFVHLFGLMVQKHDATTSTGKLSGHHGLTYLANGKNRPKDMIFLLLQHRASKCPGSL